MMADPGVFEFEKPSFLIKESVGVAQIPVTRANGCDGRVAVSWVTRDLTARSGLDYTGGEGALVFEHGETAKMIEISVHNDLVSSALLLILLRVPSILCRVVVTGDTVAYRSVVKYGKGKKGKGMVLDIAPLNDAQ